MQTRRILSGQPTKVALTKVSKIIKSLKLSNNNITVMDALLQQFHSLKYLSLTGNRISHVENLPKQLEFLALNGNLLKEYPDLFKLEHLQHVGLSHNSIVQIFDNPSSCWLPSSLLSLDLANNCICSLQNVIGLLEKLPRLKIASFSRNPVSLLACYRSTIVTKSQNLLNLDDVKVMQSERMQPDTETDFCIID